MVKEEELVIESLKWVSLQGIVITEGCDVKEQEDVWRAERPSDEIAEAAVRSVKNW